MSSFDIVVLGGGPGALALAFYARREGKTVLILEKESIPGGNAMTFHHDGYLFDSGAHRWHNVYPEITSDVKSLLGNDLKNVTAPSAIFLGDQRISFPLRPWNLLRTLGPLAAVGVALSYVTKNFSAVPGPSFTATVTRRFGKRLAGLFLIPYTQKLWGRNPDELTDEVAGKRLKGFNLGSFMGKHSEHLDGAFLYPTKGIGMIFDRIVNELPSGSIRTGVTIRRIRLENNRVVEIELDQGTIRTDRSTVISTLAPNTLTELAGLKPYPGLTFRNVLLVFFPIRRDRISDNASVYFPSSEIPFTRVVEPKIRSGLMSPAGSTSVVVEIPGDFNDELFRSDDKKIVQTVRPHLLLSFRLTENEIGDPCVKRLINAYPVLTLAAMSEREKYLETVRSISNLRLLGRNSTFSYLHLHDLFLQSKKLVSEL